MKRRAKFDLMAVKSFLGVEDESVTSTRCKVTPKQAATLLKKCNKGNRRVKMSYVQTLKRDMENGAWYKDVDYIAFDSTGKLVNGQHRLRALSMTELPYLELKFDFDTEQHVSMDTGNNRSYANQVSISAKAGVEILPNRYKTIICAGLRLSNMPDSLSNTELCKIWGAYKGDLLECDRRKLFDLGKQVGLTAKSSMLWAYLSGVDPDLLEHIAEVLRTGITERKTDIPVIRLRDAYVDLRGSGKTLELKRAQYTQQCIFNVIHGSESNRLPSNPIMHYQNFPFMDRI